MSKVYLLIPLKIFTSRPECKYIFLQTREDVFILLPYNYHSTCYNLIHSCLIIRLLFQASLNPRYRSTCTWSAPKKEIEIKFLRKLEKVKAKAKACIENTEFLRKLYLLKTFHETENSLDTCHVSQERYLKELKGYVCTQKLSDQPSYYLIGLGLPTPGPPYLATMVTLHLWQAGIVTSLHGDVDHDICDWRSHIVEDDICPWRCLCPGNSRTDLSYEEIINLQVFNRCSPGLRNPWMALISFNARTHATIIPATTLPRLDASPSVDAVYAVAGVEDESIVKPVGRLPLFADYASEIFPLYCDKFAMFFADLLRVFTSFNQNCKPSSAPKQFKIFPFLTSLCLGNMSVGQIILHFHLRFLLSLTKSKSFPLF